MNGLSGINIELTSRCNKSCWMCGRRKMEQEHPELCDWGDMPLEILEIISKQIPKGVFIQFHNNGEPLLYPHLEEALELFSGHYTGLDTNGILLMENSDSFAHLLNTITISVIQDDPIGTEQLEIAGEFLQIKERPFVMFRLLGEIDEQRKTAINSMVKAWERSDVCYRVLHAPGGSHSYDKPVVKPEVGVCLEMLHKLAIDRFGNVYPCVRYDPDKINFLGNVKHMTLDFIWNASRRSGWIDSHMNGNRNEVPLCSKCHFYGIPRG